MFGYSKLTSAESPPSFQEEVIQSYEDLQQDPVLSNATVPIIDGSNIAHILPDIHSGIPFTGYVNNGGGVVDTADALYAMYLEALRLGVEFTFNSPIDSLWWKDGRCAGVLSRHNRLYQGRAVIISAGASIPTILPSISSQVEPIAYSTAYIKLTEEETTELQNLPVLHIPDLGYLSAPDPDTQLLELCVSSIEFAWQEPSGRLAQHPTTSFLPFEAETRMRELLRQTLPQLVDRQLFNARLNWTTKTADGDFIIDKVPGTDNVFVAAGDYDKAIGLLPLIGKEVTNLVVGGTQREPRWRWKGDAREQPSETQAAHEWEADDTQYGEEDRTDLHRSLDEDSQAYFHGDDGRYVSAATSHSDGEPIVIQSSDEEEEEINPRAGKRRQV